MVNTFIPHKSFKKCAFVLDRSRLGKQRLESKMIIDILEGKAKIPTTLTKAGKPRKPAWSNHPAVLMWCGHVDALKYYYNCIVNEWVKRGYKNTMPLYNITGKIVKPWFMGCHEVHMSHRASLLAKYPEYYSRFFKVNKKFEKFSYVWPSKVKSVQKYQMIAGMRVNMAKIAQTK